MWYAEKVGHSVVFLRDLKSEKCWLSREDAGFSNIVRYVDGELIDVDNSKEESLYSVSPKSREP